MPEPVSFALLGVSIGKLLLRWGDLNDSADAVGDVRAGFDALRTLRAPKAADPVDAAITRVLEQRLVGVRDTNHEQLRIAVLNVTDLFTEMADDDGAILAAATDPQGFSAYLVRHRGGDLLANTEEALTPFTRQVMDVASVVFAERAPRSGRFIGVALVELLGQVEQVTSGVADLQRDLKAARDALLPQVAQIASQVDALHAHLLHADESRDSQDGPRFAQARREYLARVVSRYKRVDLEILTPLSEAEHPAMMLEQVFVPQHVRADPPPLEIPREVWRRLAAAGHTGDADLPEEVDRERLVEARRAYHQRPRRPVMGVLAEPAGRRMVLLGDPGSGKSTLARYLLATLARYELDGAAGESSPPAVMPTVKVSVAKRVWAGLQGWLPLLVELRTYADPRWRSGTFLDLIDHLADAEGLGLPKALLQPFLATGGKAVLIFDGLDEVFDPVRRAEITGHIDGFAAKYPRVRVVVTSRAVGYSRERLDSAGFSHWMLQDLDPGQIREFATNWYARSCPADLAEVTRLQERLLAAVQDSQAVAELAGNPMLLTILAIIGRRRELPRDRRNVYEHAVTVLVEHWDVNRHLRDERADIGTAFLDSRDKFELLHRVARGMQDGPTGLSGNYIPGPDLTERFRDYLLEDIGLPRAQAISGARAMLDQFRVRSFILARFGVEVYGFVHRAFLEYLAADDINTRLNNRDITESDVLAVYDRHWNDPAWSEVLLLLTGMIPERFAMKAILNLLTINTMWRVQTARPQHLLLALQAVAEIRKVPALSPHLSAIIHTLIALLEEAELRLYLHGDRELQTEIDTTVSRLLRVLRPDPVGSQDYQRWFRSHERHSYEGPYFSPVELTAARIHVALLPHQPSDVRTAATTDQHWGVRVAAVQAIASGWPDDPATLPLLHDRATTDNDGSVRVAAVQAIASGWPDDPATLPLLHDRATTDNDGSVRVAAVQAIASGWPDDPAPLPLLHDRATTDNDGSVRVAAVQAIASGWPDDPAPLPLLHDRATTDNDGSVRVAAVQAIASGWPDDPATLPLLHDRATTDNDGSARVAAVQAIASGWPDDPATLPLLHDRATTDQDGSARVAAVQAIASGWPDDPATLPLLHDRATTDQDRRARVAAVQAIASGWPDDPATLPLLHDRATTDQDGSVRVAAVQAIASGWPDDPATLPLLHDRATTDQNGSVRVAAVRAIASGWPDDPATLPLLHDRATTDQNGSVRRAVVRAIASGWPDDPATLPLLHDRATTDQDWSVWVAVVRAIASGWPDDPATLPLLHDRATTDQDGSVRRAVVREIASGWPDDPATLPLLHDRATTDNDGSVRRAVVRAIASGWPDDPATLPLLHDRATTDNDGSVRRAVVRAIASGWPDDPATLPLLHDRATTDQDGRVRRAVVRAIAAGWPDDPATLPLLHDRATTDQNGRVREAAVQAIASGWPDDPATQPLLRDWK